MKNFFLVKIFVSAVLLFSLISVLRPISAQAPVTVQSPTYANIPYQDPELPGMSGLTDPKVPLVVDVGQGFGISIASNRVTGYQWVLAEPLDWNLVALNNITVATPFNGKQPQITGGREVWGFKALRSGSARIRLKYIRPYETNPEPKKIMEYTVVIK